MWLSCLLSSIDGKYCLLFVGRGLNVAVLSIRQSCLLSIRQQNRPLSNAFLVSGAGNLSIFLKGCFC